MNREDPKVTGVLPVALEEATKIVQVFLHSGKEYVCLMQLHEEVTENQLRTCLGEFCGPIYQKPPLRASVKRAPRRREIYAIDLLEFGNRQALFRVACEAGTYIRKLCSDIGEVLGCGAHMRELRRTRSGPFSEQNGLRTMLDVVEAHSLLSSGDETKAREVIRPLEEAFEFVPKIIVKNSAVDALCHGADLAAPGVVKLDSAIRQGSIVGVFTVKGELIALATSRMTSEQILASEKGIVAKTDRVVMVRGTYPSQWH